MPTCLCLKHCVIQNPQALSMCVHVYMQCEYQSPICGILEGAAPSPQPAQCNCVCTHTFLLTKGSRRARSASLWSSVSLKAHALTAADALPYASACERACVFACVCVLLV